MKPETTLDTLLKGRVKLLQPKKGHRAGTDAVLLAAAIQAQGGAVIGDVGAATGAVGLMIAMRLPESRIVLVERDPGLCEMAQGNIVLNGLEARLSVVEADVVTDEPTVDALEAVATNPPFYEPRARRESPDANRNAAHIMPEGGLEVWIRKCHAMLRNNGAIAMIHRAEALKSCLDAMQGRFGGISIMPVHSRGGKPASRLLIRAIKGTRAPLNLLPPLILHEADGGFTPEARALHDGEAALG